MNALVLALYVAAFVGLVYFIGVRPTRRRRREMLAIGERLKPGDDVVTVAGIYGTVIEVEEGETLLIEVAEDVDIRIAKSSVSTILGDQAAVEAAE